MEQETIAQTMLDQLVTDENSQMLKALIPYLSFSGQRILAAYAKTQELCNTLQLFSRPQNDMQICSSRPMNPMELLNDIRKFSYGENRKKLDQAVNMFAMLEMLMTINEYTVFWGGDQMAMNDDWKNDPKLKEIDKTKLDMLQNLAEKGNGKSVSDMMPYLMSAAASGKKNGLHFSQNEISAVLEVMKAGKTPQEASKIDRIVNLMRMIH